MPDFSARALIFDMDGVLVDSEPYHLMAYQELFKSFGLTYSEDENREFLGRKDLVIAEAIIRRYGLKATAQLIVDGKEKILERLLKEHSVPRPGLTAVLCQAEQLEMPMAVASSATLPTIQLVVDRLGITRYFKSLTSGDEVAFGKPAPDVFLLAASRLAIEPRFCLVVEDTDNGIRAAKAAGMFCVAIPCDATRHQDHSAADLVLNSLAELDLATICSRC